MVEHKCHSEFSERRTPNREIVSSYLSCYCFELRPTSLTLSWSNSLDYVNAFLTFPNIGCRIYRDKSKTSKEIKAILYKITSADAFKVFLLALSFVFVTYVGRTLIDCSPITQHSVGLFGRFYMFALRTIAKFT